MAGTGGVTATQLAKELNLSKGRISQYVREKKLEGCYYGDGRGRRFDLAKVKSVLGRTLDPGQMMGNGASTQAALKGLDAAQEQPPAATPLPPAGATRLEEGDKDEYQMARTQKAIEETRRLRRQNAEAEGTFVLASEVQIQVNKMISQEIAEFESVLRDAARSIADEHGVDFKTVRATLVGRWREHRERRAKVLADAAAKAGTSEAEKEADI